MNDILERALMLGQNKKIAEEEFLVATGEKEPASFSVAPDMIALSNLTEDSYVKMSLKLDNPGYLELEVSVPDSFLKLGKRIITSDDFEDGVLYFPVVVQESKLHAGKNYSSITFRSSNQEIQVPVMVNIKVKSILDGENPKKKWSKLLRLYIDYKVGNIEPYDWMERSNEIIGNIDGNEINDMYLMLYRAHIFIELEQYTNAANILEFMAEQISKMTTPDYELFSYFYYVECLYEKDEMQTAKAVRRIRAAYEKNPSWKILWVLMHMDPAYTREPGLKLDAVYDCFVDGCCSPVMYLEALEVFRKKPEYLYDASDFELQVLWFGAKIGYITGTLSSHFADLILEQSNVKLSKINNKIAIKVLRMMYDRFPTRSLLKALCMLLIRDDNREKENQKYYGEAIREYIDNIPGLFNYYIYTIDQTKYVSVPTRVMEYFSENTSRLSSYQSYFYANLISNKRKNPEYYRAYVPAMIEYAEEQVFKGTVDNHMAVIYKDILENNLLTSNLQRGLFEILSTKRIVCHSSRMTNVMVLHSELSVYQDIVLTDGQALVKIYSGDAIVLFKDGAGNIYHNVSYDKIDLLNSKEYIDKCIQGVPLNDYMLLNDTLPLTRAYKDPVEILHYLTHNMNASSFRVSYVQKILKDTVVYFSKNSKEQEVYDELIEFFKFDLDPETRGKLIGIMIERGLYEDAFEEIKKGGFEYVEESSIAKLAHELTTNPEQKEDELLLTMCEQSFTRTTFDQSTFEYLLKYYNGKIDVMLDLYRAGNAYGIVDDTLPERVLQRTIETGEYSELVSQLFAKYYESGPNEQLKVDYLNSRAYAYFFHNEERNADFFKFIGDEMVSGTAFQPVTEVAYLKYAADKDITSNIKLQTIERKLKYYCGKSILMEEFKGYRRYFELPTVLANSVIITSIGRNSIVTYSIAPGEEVRTENMNEVMDGFFAKYITLFYGESITYHVDDKEEVTVSYDDLNIVEDESRYSVINSLIKMQQETDLENFGTAAKNYYIKSQLIDRLF
ncbi:MAG: DUF5717 family protein [Lachnospiraceae bacterium]|nr:DUF5717 family protein [Lachnospiraceae bacterium]